MKAIIIEDEVIAAQALQGLIREVDPDMAIDAVLQSIEESVEWFLLNPMPDLVFMDIHLADGSSFNIFEEVNITCPVIFATAYDEYALKAFDVNSIAYLLKPINKQDLEKAIRKYRHVRISPSENMDLINQLLANIRSPERTFKSYLLVREKDMLIPLATADIAYVYIDTKIVKAITRAGKSYFLDQTLDELAALLDPRHFFRANRQYIIAREFVKDLSLWFGGKLVVSLKVPVSEKIIVSKARTGEIKKWITG